MIDYKTDHKKKMVDWWQSSLGGSILDAERSIFQSNVKFFFGYIQLQLGLAQSLLPDVSRPCIQKVIAGQADIDGCYESLPIKWHSIDTLLLSHVLEFSSDPHQILREAERVLVADGTLVLCHFNPWSLWGIRRLFSWQDRPPWQGHFFSLARIKDWLALLNFDVVMIERTMFRPPIRSAKWFERCAFLERWGKRLWPVFSGVTIVIATKRTIPLTPITSRWQTKQLFPSGTLVNKPVIREKKNG